MYLQSEASIRSRAFDRGFEGVSVRVRGDGRFPENAGRNAAGSGWDGGVACG